MVVLLVVIAVLLLVPLVGAALWAVITAAIVGLVIGALARLVLPGQQRIGLLATMLLGWVGSFVGGDGSSPCLGFGHGNCAFIDPVVHVGVAVGKAKCASSDMPDRKRVAPGRKRIVHYP